MEAKDGRGRDLRKAAGGRVGYACKIEIKTSCTESVLGKGYCRHHQVMEE